MTGRPERLSRVIAHALRHKPWLYELELDEEGWASIDDLVEAVREVWSLADLTRDEVIRLVKSQTKARYEVREHRIRAYYGHTFPGRIVKNAAIPPTYLFHGTSPQTAPEILAQGLWPMTRQYVHLSTDHETAETVGRRKSVRPVILVVTADAAYAAGVRFWFGNEHVWLADYVPPQFVRQRSPQGQ